MIVLGPFRDVAFGEIVRQACVAKELTQEEFAKLLQVSQPRVSEIFQQNSMTEALFARCVRVLDFQYEIKLVE